MTKILLVEDNEMNQDMLTRRLLRRGYEVVLASDGEQGVSMGLAELPDLILMDISLPIMDGWEASRRLKADPRTCQIPIIALTAHAMVGDRDKCLAAGCDDYDTKPVELARLLGKVEQLLAQSRSTATIEDRSSNQTPSPQEEIVTPVIALPVIPVAVSSVDPTAARILVVDDNEMNLDMLSRRLERAGYTVFRAECGQDGLKIIRAQPVDLVLLDIMMPDMNGIEMLGLIRKQFSMSELPVIMATAKDRSEDMIEAFESGANDYVTKPIDLPLVIARIQSHLRAIQAARQEQLDTSIKVEPTPVLPKVKPISTIPLTNPLAQTTAETVDFTDHLLLGRYKISQQLTQDYGRNTYLAKDLLADGQPSCIIEQINIKSDRQDLEMAAIKQLTSEVSSFQQISDLNVAKIMAAFQQDEYFYIIQANLEGALLSEKLSAGQTLSLPDAMMLILEILEIIQVLNQYQLIHQRLHLNSFVCIDERNLQLVDLGIAARLANTLQYNNKPRNAYYPDGQGDQLSIRNDIYAAGMITLQALTGVKPNQMPIASTTGTVQWRHLRIVSASLAKILDKMISKDAHDCYHSIDSVLSDLYQLPSIALSGKKRKSIC